MFSKINFKNIVNFILFLIIFGIFFVYPLLYLSKTLTKLFFHPQAIEKPVNDDVLKKLDEELSKFLY